MHRTILLAAASAATFAAADMGKAIVVNNCPDTVYMQNTPAANNGYSTIQQPIEPGQSYSQVWTPTQVGGWSIKLSKVPNSFETHILQYEYTCQNDGIIWYDLSEVNGNPWDNNWLISAPEGAGCDPKQSAYRFWNDDANGMQDSCPQATDITLTLCSSQDGSSNSSSPAQSSAAPSSAAAAPSSTPVSSSAPAAPPAYSAPAVVSELSDAVKFPVKEAANKQATPTTMATSVKAPVDAAKDFVATVTQLVTHMENVYVTHAPRAEPHVHHRHHARHGHQF